MASIPVTTPQSPPAVRLATFTSQTSIPQRKASFATMGHGDYEYAYESSGRTHHATQGTHHGVGGQPGMQYSNHSHAQGCSTSRAPLFLRTESAPATSSAGGCSGASHRSYRPQEESETDDHEPRGRTLHRGTEHDAYYPKSDAGGKVMPVNGTEVFITSEDLRGVKEQQRQMRGDAALSVFGNDDQGTDGNKRGHKSSRHNRH